MADASSDPDVQKALRTYANETYTADILSKSISVLDILEQYPSVNLPLGSFLLMLPSMRMRQ
jgi:cytochrome P450/NADPH-cytochrome P450 reductase